MILKGITANFLGDSITEGLGLKTPEKEVFHQLIKQKYGLKEARNYGVSATRIAKQTTPSFYPRHDLDFVLRAKDMENDADLVVVFGGTNDFGHSDAPLGKLTDKTNTTFYGALDVLFSLLKEKYPDSKIVVLTPLHRIGEESTCGLPIGKDYRKPEGSHPLKDYAKALKEKAKEHSLPIIDLFEEQRLNPNDEEVKEKYFIDTTHPNALGHELLAEIVAQKLLEI